MDVALHRADDHLAEARGARLDQQWLQYAHAALHGVRSLEHLGHKQNAIPEIVADDAHAFNERLGQDVIRHPFALEQDVDRLDDLVAQTVIEIVEHLRDQLFIAERSQVQFFIVRHGRSSTPIRPGRDGNLTSVAKEGEREGQRLHRLILTLNPCLTTRSLHRGLRRVFPGDRHGPG